MKKSQPSVTLQIPSELPPDYVPTPAEGLSRAEAEQRMRRGKGNRARDDSRKPLYRILCSNLFTFFNLLNILLALCLVLVGSYRNMLFLGVVISNTVIGTVQEIRAQRTIRRLRLTSPEQVGALREGKVTPVTPTELVEGDLVVLRRGDQVPADAVVRSGLGAANESMLTGESLDITKQEGDWLLSGTFLTEGEVTAQLVYVGESSYISRLSHEARKIRPPKSALMTDLGKLTRRLSMVLVPLGILLFLKQHFMLSLPMDTAVPQAVAAMVGMIPEGLILLTSVALCVGVVRLGRKGALVSELYGIETLSRADILCLDKTGTLTCGDMRLRETVPVQASMEEARSALARMVSAFPEDDTPSFSALRAAQPGSGEKPDHVIPFSSARKCSCAVFSDRALILGAPSFVMRGGLAPDISARCEDYAAQGLRVLLLADAPACAPGDFPEPERVLALLVLEDRIRPEAEDTLRYFREEGVHVKILSGDDPRTVAAIAHTLSLPGADRFVDCSVLSDEELAACCEDCTIFGRVSPAQKQTLVNALQKAGHHVAMTGDGVNDIPALKAADCSIAMASGSQAARNASQLTLIASDFSVLPEVVAEGRRVVNNVTRSASLFLVKTLYSFFLSVLLLFLPATYPFQPIQLTAVSGFTIGIPAFFLSLEANRDRIRGKFLRTILLNALPGAVCVTLCAGFCMVMENFGWSMRLGSTMATICAGGIGMMVLIGVSLPMNRYRGTVCACMAVCLTLVFLFAGNLMYFTPPDPVHLLVFAALMAFSALLLFVLTRAMRRWADRP